MVIIEENSIYIEDNFRYIYKENSVKIIGYENSNVSEIEIPLKIQNIKVTSLKLDDIYWKTLEKIILHEFIESVEYEDENLGKIDDIIIENKKYLLISDELHLPKYIIIHRYGIFRFIDESLYYEPKHDYKNKLYWCRLNDEITVTGACLGEKHLIIPDIINGLKVSRIAENGFVGEGIKSIKLPKYINQIDESAFKNNNISRLLLTEDLRSIKSQAFMENNITHIGFSIKTKEIGSRAFANNSISYINLPISLIKIENDSFENNCIEKNIMEISSKLRENYVFFNKLENSTELTDKGDLNFNNYPWGTSTEIIKANEGLSFIEFDNFLVYERELLGYDSQVAYWFRSDELYKIDVSFISDEKFQSLEKNFLKVFYEIVAILNRECGSLINKGISVYKEEKNEDINDLNIDSKKNMKLEYTFSWKHRNTAIKLRLYLNSNGGLSILVEYFQV